MQLRLRYWIRLLKAFLTRFRAILFAGIVFGLLFFVALTVVLPRIFTGQVEYIGITGRYRTDELPPAVLNMIGEGLTKVSENGTVEAALAESWETNSEGTEWTFKIKPGKVWHDGTPVTANTIQYSFEDAEIERPDESTIKFKLSSPFSPFPSVVSKPTFKKGLLGTGEWKVLALKLSGPYVEEVVLRNEKGARKILRFYPSDESTKIAFELGKVNMLSDFLDSAPFDAWATVSVEKVIREDRIVAIFFKLDNPEFSGPDKKALRQALSYAIQKDDFEGPRALGPISPNSWAYNPLVKDYAFDPDRARELLKDRQGIEINLTTTPVLLKVAEKVAGFWEDVGVKTNIQVVSALPEDYEAFLAIYDMPRDPDQYAVWHTTQTQTNVSKYSNPRIDKLLEDGRVELNFEERKKIYLDFQRFLLEDAPAVFLYHPVSYTITRK